jgi:hypothetical protein
MRRVIRWEVGSSFVIPPEVRQMTPAPGRDRISEGAPT